MSFQLGNLRRGFGGGGSLLFGKLFRGRLGLLSLLKGIAVAAT
ncbi:MAG TPA: hypothetical protein VE988_20510 [Gemmataceae bacterium]|nr:hypothetical protein [Gemmataceae bacterium]